MRYHLSGIVTDETGSPIAAAGVEVHYRNDWRSTVTNGGGYYEFVFEPGPGPVFGAEVAGVIHSWHEGYESNIQVLPRGTAEIVQNLHLRRVRTVSAGESITVSVEPESSLCSDLDYWLLSSRCANVTILVDNPGTLTVEARAVEAGGIIPVVFFESTGWYTSPQTQAPGTASVGVQARERYRIFVGIPSEMAAHQFEVSTSLR